MPRRKATKKPAKVRRSSIKVEIDCTISEEERKRKLEAFMADFENERQARLRAIRDDGDNLFRKMNNVFHAELLKIPKAVREMKFVDFKYKYNCDINTVLLESTQAELDKLKKPMTVGKPRKAKKTTTVMETIDEDESRTVKRMESTMFPDGATQTSRMTRTAARTAAPQWADTPMITPAFNPRLMRTAKPRQMERCTFLFDTTSSPKIEIPMNGKNVILSKTSRLDDQSRGVLENIHKMIYTMLEKE